MAVLPMFHGLSQALSSFPWEWAAENEFTFGLEQEMWEPGYWTCRIDQPGDCGETILNSATKPAYAVRAVTALIKARGEQS